MTSTRWNIDELPTKIETTTASGDDKYTTTWERARSLRALSLDFYAQPEDLEAHELLRSMRHALNRQYDPSEDLTWASPSADLLDDGDSAFDHDLTVPRRSLIPTRRGGLTLQEEADIKERQRLFYAQIQAKRREEMRGLCNAYLATTSETEKRQIKEMLSSLEWDAERDAPALPDTTPQSAVREWLQQKQAKEQLREQVAAERRRRAAELAERRRQEKLQQKREAERAALAETERKRAAERRAAAHAQWQADWKQQAAAAAAEQAQRRAEDLQRRADDLQRRLQAEAAAAVARAERERDNRAAAERPREGFINEDPEYERVARFHQLKVDIVAVIRSANNAGRVWSVDELLRHTGCSDRQLLLTACNELVGGGFLRPRGHPT